jgi:protease secretion system membrane fusion protein
MNSILNKIKGWLERASSKILILIDPILSKVFLVKKIRMSPLLDQLKKSLEHTHSKFFILTDLALNKILLLEAKLFGLNVPKTESNSEFYFAKKGMRILVYGLFGFLLWAAFAPLDKGAPASGVVISDGNRKVVQQPASGIIDEILVRDGDRVISGQILIKINPTSALGQVNAMNESLAGLSAQNAQLSISINAKKMQLQIMSQQVIGLKNLSKEGYIARNKLLDFEREVLRTQDALESDQGTFQKNQGQIAELRERISILQFDLENTDIKAPVDGTVVNLSVFTKGAVIPQGGKLLEIVPLNVPLVIDAEVPTQLIDKVYPGLEVELMFTAFNQNKTPKIFGRVHTISADRLIDEKNGFPYYKIRVEVNKDGEKKLKNFNVRPGMSVEVFIKTGERTLLSYLFKPLFDRMHSALREE